MVTRIGDIKEIILLFHEKAYRNNDARFMRHNREYNHDGTVNENFHAARHDMVTQRHKRILKYLDKNSTFFDIGAGAGTFLRQIKNLMWRRFLE